MIALKSVRELIQIIIIRPPLRCQPQSGTNAEIVVTIVTSGCCSVYSGDRKLQPNNLEVGSGSD